MTYSIFLFYFRKRLSFQAKSRFQQLFEHSNMTKQINTPPNLDLCYVLPHTVFRSRDGLLMGNEDVHSRLFDYSISIP